MPSSHSTPGTLQPTGDFIGSPSVCRPIATLPFRVVLLDGGGGGAWRACCCGTRTRQHVLLDREDNTHCPLITFSLTVRPRWFLQNIRVNSSPAHAYDIHLSSTFCKKKSCDLPSRKYSFESMCETKEGRRPRPLDRFGGPRSVLSPPQHPQFLYFPLG